MMLYLCYIHQASAEKFLKELEDETLDPLLVSVTGGTTKEEEEEGRFSHHRKEYGLR